MAGWEWIATDAVLAMHSEQLTQHGGPAGVRDLGALESALARPANLAAYGEPDAAALAAAYAFGIARNHPFIDGNKRIAAVVSVSFLLLNGLDFGATPAELAAAFLSLAASELTEEEMAAWFRLHLGKS